MGSDKNVVKKIMQELRAGEKRALIVEQRMKSIRPELQPCIASWKNGRRLPFSHAGISLDEIMEKEKVGYLEAVFKMDVLMNNPEMAEQYKNFRFIRR